MGKFVKEKNLVVYYSELQVSHRAVILVTTFLVYSSAATSTNWRESSGLETREERLRVLNLFILKKGWFRENLVAV